MIGLVDMQGMAALTEAIRDYGRFMPHAILLSTRVAIVLIAMPAPFGSLAPMQVRAGLSLAIALMLTVTYLPTDDMLPLHGFWLLCAGFGEMLVGGVIGLTVRVTLAAAEVAGSAASFAMGLGFATSIEPNYGESSSPPAQVLALLSTLIFLLFDGHHAVVRALGESVALIPPGQVLARVFHDSAFTLGGRMMARGLQIAAPVLGTMMIVQIGLALSSRAAPQVHLMYLSFAISIAAGVLTLFVSAPAVATAIVMEVRQLPQLLADALGVR